MGTRKGRVRMRSPLQREEQKRLDAIRFDVEQDRRNGVAVRPRYAGDAYSDRMWLLNLIDRLFDEDGRLEGGGVESGGGSATGQSPPGV